MPNGSSTTSPAITSSCKSLRSFSSEPMPTILILSLDFFSATAWPTVSVVIGSETNTPRRSAVLAMRSFMDRGGSGIDLLGLRDEMVAEFATFRVFSARTGLYSQDLHDTLHMCLVDDFV